MSLDIQFLKISLRFKRQKHDAFSPTMLDHLNDEGKAQFTLDYTCLVSGLDCTVGIIQFYGIIDWITANTKNVICL